MRGLRQAVFWVHLAVGLLAGLIVFVMSVTGTMMAFERQITAWADDFHLEPPAGGEVVGVEEHLEKCRTAKPAITAISLTLAFVCWQIIDRLEQTALGR